MNETWVKVFAACIALIVTIDTIVIINKMDEDSDLDIPEPPYGYEYCTSDDGNALGFCRKSFTR